MTYLYHWFSEQVRLAGDLGSTNDVLIPLVEMDDANLTMEEYIELEAETARRRGQMYNWETSTYGKVRYHENFGYFKDFETNFPAIIFDDALATNHKISSQPTVSPLDDNEIDFRILFDEYDDEDYTFIYDKNSFSCKLVPVDLQTDSENDIIKVNVSSGDIFIEQSENSIDANVDTQSYGYDKDFEMNHDIHSEPFNRKNYIIMIKVYLPDTGFTYMAPLPARDQRHPWLRYEGQEYTDAIIYAYEDRLGMRGRISDIVLDLDHDVTLCFYLGGLRRQMGWRQFILAIGLHTAEDMETDGIASDGDFLGVVPSYTSIWDPLRRLCHRLIAFSIFGRGQAPEKVAATDLFYLRSMDEGMAINIPYLLAQYLFRHVEGRKKGARMSDGQFISHLVEHFGLLTKERLRGLTVVVRDLTVIDRLRICERLGYTWAWVVPRPERQQVVAVGAA
ncbi:hypothetical protein Tco_0570477 [Tanacetum coccineum]